MPRKSLSFSLNNVTEEANAVPDNIMLVLPKRVSFNAQLVMRNFNCMDFLTEKIIAGLKESEFHTVLKHTILLLVMFPLTISSHPS